LSARYVALVFARWGIDLAASRQGRPGAAPMPPWPCRRCLEMVAARRRARARS